jgi:branched-chain amino acid transport system substrate-binding protein
LGGLFSLTGANADADVGIAFNASIDYANQFVKMLKYDIEFAGFAVDDKGDANSIASMLPQFTDKNIHFVIGPLYSFLLTALQPSLTDIVALSPGSTSTSLSRPGDNIFRMFPDDRLQATASYHMFESLKVNNVVIIHGDEPYGNGYAEVFRSMWTTGSLVEIVYPEGTTDFSDVLAQANGNVTTTDGWGVLLVSLQEGVDLLSQAGTGASTYPNLQVIPWLGTDVLAADPTLLQNTDAVNFCIKVHFSASTPGVDNSTILYQNVTKILADAGVTSPTVRVLATWDSVMLAVAVYIGQEQNMPVELLRQAIPGWAELSYGVTGWLVLNENGDRAVGVYDFYQIAMENGQNRWVKSETLTVS